MFNFVVLMFKTTQYHSQGVADVQFYGAGTGLLASGARDNTIALWDVYAPKIAGNLH
jgi:WD40 repeat protein